MGEWKLILGNEEKEIRGFKGAESRIATVYYIVTCDTYGFELHEYEKVSYDDLYEKKNPKTGELEKVMSNVLDIDGELYRMRGSREDGKFYSDFNGIVDAYIKNYKLSKPTYDIKTVEDAIIHFKELSELKNELLSLK